MRRPSLELLWNELTERACLGCSQITLRMIDYTPMADKRQAATVVELASLSRTLDVEIDVRQTSKRRARG
jgi:hypothetical protein